MTSNLKYFSFSLFLNIQQKSLFPSPLSLLFYFSASSVAITKDQSLVIFTCRHEGSQSCSNGIWVQDLLFINQKNKNQDLPRAPYIKPPYKMLQLLNPTHMFWIPFKKKRKKKKQVNLRIKCSICPNSLTQCLIYTLNFYFGFNIV